jgi:hypothetical protein
MTIQLCASRDFQLAQTGANGHRDSPAPVVAPVA